MADVGEAEEEAPVKFPKLAEPLAGAAVGAGVTCVSGAGGVIWVLVLAGV